MAGDELIDDYLTGLRRRLAWRPDVDDVVAEAEDHLLSAVERSVAGGSTAEQAEREVLGRFGDATTVATAFASTGTGGLAVPTRFTKRAGVAAYVSGGLWALAAVTWLADQQIEAPAWAESGGALTLIAAAATTAIVMAGLIRRHGGLGVIGVIGLGLVGFGALATVLWWFVMGWGVFLAVGMLLVAIAVHSRGLAPRAANAAFGVAWAVGVVTWSVLRALEVGTRDRWGDYPVVSPIAVTVAVIILVPGLIGLGRWLSTENPVDLDPRKHLSTA